MLYTRFPLSFTLSMIQLSIEGIAGAGDVDVVCGMGENRRNERKSEFEFRKTFELKMVLPAPPMPEESVMLAACEYSANKAIATSASTK